MYLALKRGVATLDELGFFYVDNGTSTLRLRSSVACRARVAGGDLAQDLAQAHPEFFVALESVDEAARSFDSAGSTVDVCEY